jgi:DNA-binding transcriptional MerR regulator
MYTVSKAALLAGVTADTLRYYEKVRLIVPPSRTASGYRLYDAGTLRRSGKLTRLCQLGAARPARCAEHAMFDADQGPRSGVP